MATSTWTDLRTGIVGVINGLDDMGTVTTRQSLHIDWTTYLNQFKTRIDGRDQIRGAVVVPGDPFKQTSVDAIGGSMQDVYYFEIFLVQAAKDEDDHFDAALNRAIQLAEALDAKQSWGLTSEEVFYAGPASIRFHDWRLFGNVGVWYTNIMYDITVNRTVSYI